MIPVQLGYVLKETFNTSSIQLYFHLFQQLPFLASCDTEFFLTNNLSLISSIQTREIGQKVGLQCSVSKRLSVHPAEFFFRSSLVTCCVMILYATERGQQMLGNDSCPSVLPYLYPELQLIGDSSAIACALNRIFFGISKTLIAILRSVLKQPLGQNCRCSECVQHSIPIMLEGGLFVVVLVWENKPNFTTRF